jgi:PemK-like, MazF-like toxin of type II toxin-antitoxin system
MRPNAQPPRLICVTHADIRQGEIWTYIPQGSPRQRVVVIVSSDGINQSARPWLLAVEITDEDPEDILAVPIERHGWILASNLFRVYRGWLRERIDELAQQEWDRLASVLRAALDL